MLVGCLQKRDNRTSTSHTTGCTSTGGIHKVYIVRILTFSFCRNCRSDKKVSTRSPHDMLKMRRGEAEVQLQSIRNPILVGGRSTTRSAWLIPGKDPVLFYEEAGWASGPVEMAQKISPPPESDPRTVQPITSRYTD